MLFEEIVDDDDDDDDELEELEEAAAAAVAALEFEVEFKQERAAVEAAVFGARAAVDAACAVGFGDLF